MRNDHGSLMSDASTSRGRGRIDFVIKRLWASSSVRGFAILTSGTVLAQALPVLLTPLVTRLYSADEIGMLGLWTSFVTFAMSVVTLGYSQAIVAAKNDSESAELAILSTRLVIPMSVLAGVFFIFLIQNELLGYGELPVWSALAMVASLALTGVFFILRYWLVRFGQYREISTVTVSQSVGRMLTQVIAGFLGVGWVGLIAGELVGRAAGMGRAWRSSRASFRASLPPIETGRLRRLAHENKDFAIYATPSSLINNLALVLPVPLITLHYGIHAAGQYSIASNVMVLPLALIGTSIGDIFHSRIAAISRTEPDKAIPLFTKVVLGLLTAGVFPMVMISLYGGQLFGTVLGPNWRMSGEIAGALTPWILLQFAARPASRLVQVYRGQRIKLAYDILVLSSVSGAISFGAMHGWSIVKTCTLLGWTQAFAYGIYILLLRRILRRNRLVNYSAPES